MAIQKPFRPDERAICLVKANDDLGSNCPCQEGLAFLPVLQMADPWNGSGWQFWCIRCGGYFTFARVERSEDTWEGLTRRMHAAANGFGPSQEPLDDWEETIIRDLAGVELGRTYVYLYGSLIPKDAGRVYFKGKVAWHELSFVPQVAALKDPTVLETILENEFYWDEHRVKNLTVIETILENEFYWDDHREKEDDPFEDPSSDFPGENWSG